MKGLINEQVKPTKDDEKSTDPNAKPGMLKEAYVFLGYLFVSYIVFVALSIPMDYLTGSGTGSINVLYPIFPAIIVAAVFTKKNLYKRSKK
ncbi:hypothetical protein B1748_23740 [Paenibacillus sp. MY03]|uniref:hypothetical protein n=1 Tax=Paenibacillus sp. MY03 TaxID=302980 RepID=UPI000B3C492F|nr:hypothetical protein [Paenibacillus sp. MY03]OUS73022.1 hypothetical protein B1748_23740 [Paenibacillus sp. MY03]